MPEYIQFSTNPVKNVTSKTLPMVNKLSMKSLFTDNSKVVYKPGSLAPGGVGTVKNSRMKSVKT